MNERLRLVEDVIDDQPEARRAAGEDFSLTVEQQGAIEDRVAVADYALDIQSEALTPKMANDGVVESVQVTPESLGSSAKNFIDTQFEPTPKRLAEVDVAAFEKAKKQRSEAGHLVLSLMNRLEANNTPTTLAPDDAVRQMEAEIGKVKRGPEDLEYIESQKAKIQTEIDTKKQEFHRRIS